MEMNLQPIKTQISSNLSRVDNEAFGSGISSYRKFLSKMDELCNEDLKMPNKNNRKENDIATFHNRCSVMLPKDIQKLFGVSI